MNIQEYVQHWDNKINKWFLSPNEVVTDKDDFQFYMIDGFIVSNNIKVKKIKTKQLDFKNTDHNPVVLDIRLK